MFRPLLGVQKNSFGTRVTILIIMLQEMKSVARLEFIRNDCFSSFHSALELNQNTHESKPKASIKYDMCL